MSERNWLGYRSETIAAEYETDAALAEWMAVDPDTFPPKDHFFWAAYRAEFELRSEDEEWRRQRLSANSTAVHSPRHR